MAVRNPWKITCGTLSVGGDSDDYLLHGPYAFNKSHSSLRLVFDVVVVASSHDTLQTLSDVLETEFSKRDSTFIIDIDGSTWTYTSGSNALNVVATVSKPGSQDADRGVSRAYSVTIEAELPATDNSGLRDLEVNVNLESGRQKVVTMRGVYAQGGASAQYKSAFDSEASTILTGIDGSATFELVDESYDRDRNDHNCSFSRQYVQLLSNQESGTLDSTVIRDHRVSFSEMTSQPGDSKEEIYRMRRVIGSYDCALDVEQYDRTANAAMVNVFESKLRPLIVDRFQDNFSPKVFVIEDQRASYDETTQRVSVSITFVYQKDGGQDVVEVRESKAIREVRSLAKTYPHSGDEFAAIVDPGWATRERITTRTVMVIGEETPAMRIGEDPKAGPAGKMADVVSGRNVNRSGWNLVENFSTVTPQWLGIPGIDGVEQVRVTILDETVVEMFNRDSGSTKGGFR